MIRRAAAGLLIVWAAGFAVFVLALPGPAPITAAGPTTDAVVVPTGGAGRIERGLEVLRLKKAHRMLVTGVDPEVKPREFAAEFDVPVKAMRCCVTLGYTAVDTRSNAKEIQGWVAQNGHHSVRLVTTDWHMWRASQELRRVLPDHVTVVEDAVPSQPSFRILFLEYNKLIASQLARLWPAA